MNGPFFPIRIVNITIKNIPIEKSSKLFLAIHSNTHTLTFFAAAYIFYIARPFFLSLRLAMEWTLGSLLIGIL